MSLRVMKRHGNLSKTDRLPQQIKNLLRNDIKIEEASYSFSLVKHTTTTFMLNLFQYTTTQRPLFNTI